MRSLQIGALAGLLMLANAGYAATPTPLEQQFLYRPDIGQFTTEPLSILPKGFRYKSAIETVKIPSTDGVTLNAWFVAPKAGQPTVLFAHGNAGTIAERYPQLDQFARRGYGFLVFDYRGYGLSTGTPTEAGLYADVRAASRYLDTVQRIAPACQIMMGESLGGAVAVDAATDIPFHSVLLYSTFQSIPALAPYLLETGQLPLPPDLPLESVITQNFASIDKIARVKSPLLIVHSADDVFIPPSHGQALYDAARAKRKRFLLLPAGRHDAFNAAPATVIEALEGLQVKPVARQ